MSTIRLSRSGDAGLLLSLWLRSVRATHDFLSEADIEALIPAVRDGALAQLEVWVLTGEDDEPIGFMGLDGAKLEALFVDPSHAGMGVGSRLLAHARMLKGALTVDVNEQNPAALAFYRARGFVVVSRSETDGESRPFPLLHLAEPTSNPA